jgi:hypothetical protein
MELEKLLTKVKTFHERQNKNEISSVKALKILPQN